MYRTITGVVVALFASSLLAHASGIQRPKRDNPNRVTISPKNEQKQLDQLDADEQKDALDRQQQAERERAQRDEAERKQREQRDFEKRLQDEFDRQDREKKQKEEQAARERERAERERKEREAEAIQKAVEPRGGSERGDRDRRDINDAPDRDRDRVSRIA
jgi:hypothetical protein